ncbi:MAG: hypothetical protein ACTHMH_03110 [Curtobacterium sp.]
MDQTGPDAEETALNDRSADEPPVDEPERPEGHEAPEPEPEATPDEVVESEPALDAIESEEAQAFVAASEEGDPLPEDEGSVDAEPIAEAPPEQAGTPDDATDGEPEPESIEAEDALPDDDGSEVESAGEDPPAAEDPVLPVTDDFDEAWSDAAAQEEPEQRTTSEDDAHAEPAPDAIETEEADSFADKGDGSEAEPTADEPGAAEDPLPPVADEFDRAWSDAAAEDELQQDVDPAPHEEQGSDASEDAVVSVAGSGGWTTAEELSGQSVDSGTSSREADEPTVDEPEALAEPEGEEDPNAPEESEPEADAQPVAGEPSVEVPATPASAEPIAAAAAAAAPPRPAGARPASSGGGRPPRGPRPLRERFGREAIGIAVLLVLALVCAGLIVAVVVKTQRDAAIAAQEAAAYTPPPLTTPTPTPTPTGPVVAIIGDGTASSVATSLGGTVSTEVSNGMGYTTSGSSGETFVQAAAKIPSNTAVVVFFGGAADANASSLSLTTAATKAFAAARSQAPKAKLVVVGPAIDGGVSTTELASIRVSLQSAAGITKATWVDPIADGWLSTAKQSASSPSSLTSSDDKTIASKLDSAIKKSLG